MILQWDCFTVKNYCNFIESKIVFFIIIICDTILNNNINKLKWLFFFFLDRSILKSFFFFEQVNLPHTLFGKDVRSTWPSML